MSASWSSPPRRCGATACRRAARAARVSAIATAVTGALVLLAWQYRAVTGPACILSSLAALTARSYRCPHGNDWISALMDDLGMPIGCLPARWGPADWDELEQELNR